MVCSCYRASKKQVAKKKTSNPISAYLSKIGQKGGTAGTGAAKARSPEQARKANAASHEAKRKKRQAEGGSAEV